MSLKGGAVRERKFQIGLTIVLLAGTVWYVYAMAQYSSNAGRVPILVALVTIAALIMQLLVDARPKSKADAARADVEAEVRAEVLGDAGAVEDGVAAERAAQPITAAVASPAAVGGDGATTARVDAAAEDDPGDPLATAEARVEEVEKSDSGFDVLIDLKGQARWRFLAIVVFSILFHVVSLLVGFVITTGVLITAFLFVARERWFTAVAAGAISAAAVYVLVVVVLDMQALTGYFF